MLLRVDVDRKKDVAELTKEFETQISNGEITAKEIEEIYNNVADGMEQHSKCRDFFFILFPKEAKETIKKKLAI